MKTLTYKLICSWDPCYDPIKFIPKDWQGTALDVLRADNVPIEDRLWVVLREEAIDSKTLRLFAVWCAREALKLIKDPDPRSIAACNVAERFAHGQATAEELTAAQDAAWDAAWDAARDAAWDAARIEFNSIIYQLFQEVEK